MPKIALDDIINVQVTASARAQVRSGYNVGLIVGQSARVPQSVRIVEFQSLTEMAEYGFQETDAEYIAAVKYFGQAAVPPKVCVARMAPANVTQTVTPVASGVTNPQVNAATFKAAIGDKDGVYVFSYSTEWRLNGKAVSMTDYGITYTGTAASGNTITVTYTSGATAESWVEAIADCANKNDVWYGVYCACPISEGTATRLTASEHVNIAGYVNGIRACYFFEDNDTDDTSSGTTDVFSLLMAAGYERYCGLYSATLMAGAAVMGYAMGANTGEANSAYSLAYKALAGVTPDDLSESQIKTLQSKYANYYILRGGSFTVVEQGVSGYNGKFVDELIGVDQLTDDLQKACMTVLTTLPKVPYTDAGVLSFIAACNAVLNDSVRTGFLTPGIWKGGTVLNVANGDTFETGYVVQAETVASQSAEMRANRVCPPIYVCAILAGAIHSIIIKLDVE